MAIYANNAKMKKAEIDICGDLYIETSGSGEDAVSEVKMRPQESNSAVYAGLTRTLQEKGENLITELKTTLNGFSGNTKDVVMKKIGDINAQGTPDEGKLAYLVCTMLPEMLKQIAVIIEVNRSMIEQYDTGLANALQETQTQTPKNS